VIENNEAKPKEQCHARYSRVTYFSAKNIRWLTVSAMILII